MIVRHTRSIVTIVMFAWGLKRAWMQRCKARKLEVILQDRISS